MIHCQDDSPLVGGMDSFVKNLEHFVRKIKNLELKQNDTSVSFDIGASSQDVPVEDALSVV